MRVKTKGAWGFLESPAFGSAGRAALTGDECVIGSAPGSDIFANDPTVSRRHAVLRHIAGQCEVADLGSTNGTFVNGRRVTGAAALADHDVVRLGDVKLTFVRPSSGSRSNGKRLAYIALFLVAIGGIGFAATSYFVEKPNVASEESSKPSGVAAAIASPLPTVSVPPASGKSVPVAATPNISDDDIVQGLRRAICFNITRAGPIGGSMPLYAWMANLNAAIQSEWVLQYASRDRVLAMEDEEVRQYQSGDWNCDSVKEAPPAPTPSPQKIQAIHDLLCEDELMARSLNRPEAGVVHEYAIRGGFPGLDPNLDSVVADQMKKFEDLGNACADTVERMSRAKASHVPPNPSLDEAETAVLNEGRRWICTSSCSDPNLERAGIAPHRPEGVAPGYDFHMDGRCTEHLDRMYDGFNFGDATDDDIQRLISTETGSYNKDWRCKDISTEPSGSRMAAQSLAQAFKAVEASEARSKDQNLHRLMCQNMLKYAASRGMMTMRHSEENFYKSSGINPITIGLNPDRILSEVGSHTAGNWNCASIEY